MDEQKTVNNEGVLPRARMGDEAALKIIYERHFSPVFRTALRYTGSVEDAEEIADLLGCSESNVKTHVMRLLAKLRRRLRFFRSKTAWAVAGAAGVFLAGIMIGTGILRPDRPAASQAAMIPDNILRACLDRLDPLLVDFQVKGKSPAPAEVIEFERRMTAELRRDTALLKEAARLAGQSALVDILDEIDVLLVSLSYLQSGDRDAADQLRRIIRDNRQVWEASLLSFENAL